MATNNAINLSAPGVAYYDGAGTFSGVTGATDLVLTSTGVSSAPIYKAGVDLHTANFIVGSGPSANFTTIAAAYAAAVSAGGKQTVFIQDGTYTENITLTPGVNISAFGSSSSQDGSGNVIISGTVTMTATGSCTIYGIQLQTNSAFAVVVSGANACSLSLTNCYINALNNTGISFTNSNAASFISLEDCNGDIGTTGIALYASSAAGSIFILGSYISNSGLSTTASSNSSGTVGINYSNLSFPMATTGTGNFAILTSSISTASINTISFNAGGSGDLLIQDCNVFSGTASICTVGATFQVAILNCVLGSTNANVLTGAGTCFYSSCFFPLNNNVNVTTTRAFAAMGVVGSAPAPSAIGEQIRATLASGTPVSLTNNAPLTVTSISLTAGVWDVSGIVGFISGGTTSITQLQMSISTTNNALQGNYGDDTIANSFTAQIGIQQTLTIPALRITLLSTTTIYLTTQGAFTLGTLSAYGRISATRVG